MTIPAATLLRSGSRTETTSPRSNEPSTSTIPAGSRLRLPSTSARRAPQSTTTSLLSASRLSIHRLRLSILEAVAGKNVPMRSPSSSLGRTSLSRPLAMTTSTPEAVASLAAWSFVSMPPLPWSSQELPPMASTLSSSCSTVGTSTAPASRLGSAV